MYKEKRKGKQTLIEAQVFSKTSFIQLVSKSLCRENVETWVSSSKFWQETPLKTAFSCDLSKVDLLPILQSEKIIPLVFNSFQRLRRKVENILQPEPLVQFIIPGPYCLPIRPLTLASAKINLTVMEEKKRWSLLKSFNAKSMANSTSRLSGDMIPAMYNSLAAGRAIWAPSLKGIMCS